MCVPAASAAWYHATMSVSFRVADVARATEPLREWPLRRATHDLLRTRVEACGAAADSLVPAAENAFLTAAWLAFSSHRPLVWSPDAVWLCIAHGFALHVNAHAEALRGRFVRHAGRVRLRVQRDDFVPGSPDNPWPEVFAAFSDQIAEHIGRQRDLVVCDFSTTGPIERAASEIVLMDAMQKYFSYQMTTLCGIPEVTLLGIVDDWRSVRRRAAALAEYELGWWTDALLPILDELVAAAEGRPDIDFWGHLFKHSSKDGSGGGTFVHGWILLFFPYFTGFEENQPYIVNPILAQVRGASPVRPGGGAADWVFRSRVRPDDIPLGVSVTPVEWSYLGVPISMEFVGGFLGVAQDPETLALSPAIGWAVRAPGVAGRRPDVDNSATSDEGHRLELGDLDLVVPQHEEYPILRAWIGGVSAGDPTHAADADGVFLLVGSVACSRATTPSGWLALADSGLWFVPGSEPTRRRRLGALTAGVPGMIHLPPADLVDLELERLDTPPIVTNPCAPTAIVTLEFAVRLASGERLSFQVGDPDRGAIAAWRAALGHFG